MLIGYARVSSLEQNLDLQVDALKKAGCDRIFEEKVSGVRDERPQLAEAMGYLREGDTLVVWRLDRLGRSLLNLIKLVNEIQGKGIGFKSLVEQIDTTTPTGTFFFHVTGAFAQLERSIIIERTRAGLIAARARGRMGGRPRAFDDETFEMALKLYKDKTRPVGDICSKLGINKRTFYTHLKRSQVSF